MDSRNSPVGWTDAQWNRVQEEVLREWQRVRVAGSFLPVYGPVPPSTQVVPSEVIKPGGDVDDSDTSRILELYAPVTLSGQLVNEDDLAGAILQFRRAATALALTEDDVLFNGQYVDPAQVLRTVQPSRFPPVLLNNTEDSSTISLAQSILASSPPAPAVTGRGAAPASPPPVAPAATPAANGRAFQAPTPQAANVGPLGMVPGAGSPIVIPAALSGDNLLTAVASAVATLETNGYGRPFVCVLGQEAFVEAHRPERGSLVLPADRIEPLLGRQLLRAKAIDDAQSDIRGIVISLAGDGLDLALAAEATPEFTSMSESGDYQFRVFERIALRIKDNNAIVQLRYSPPASVTNIDVGHTGPVRVGEEVTATVGLFDETYKPLAWTQVVLTGSDKSTIAPSSMRTNASGVAEFKVSNSEAGVVVFSALVDGEEVASVGVTFVP